jgi:FkbM family methyltransferase
MQTQLVDTLAFEETPKLFSIKNLLLQKWEKIKLQRRAEKYRRKEDSGGIAYIRNTIKKNDTVFDIGAHKAGYLYFFIEQLAHSGSVIAFEPQPILFNYLQKLKHLFYWPNVRIESFAVSDKVGKALLYIPYNHGRPSSPCATIIENRLPFRYQLTEEVNTISIDAYCKQHNMVPDFLKIDVEGNELLVFQGAKEILQTRKPPILFECEKRFVGTETMSQTFAFLISLGYNGYFIMGSNMLPLSEFDPIKHQDINGRIYCNNFIFQ